jgi:osmotically-inducible protein OsmY
MEYRIKAAIEDRKLTRKEAITFIKKLDKQGLNWTRFLYGVDWNDPALYDIVISLDRISVESAADIIAQMAGMDDFKPDENSIRALDNQVLSSLVWAALTKDKRTNSSNLQVVADNGKVTISGSAGSKKSLMAIDEVTRGVKGVTEVINEVGIGTDWQW